MGRLIDADALIKKMNEFCGNQRYLIPEQVWEIVETQPTAYDPEKVVAELEKLKSNEGFGGTLQKMYADGKIEKAIEIVRKGGVE